MSNLDPILSAEELQAVHARFPRGYLEGRGRRQVPLHEIITDSGPLTEEHVAAAQALIESGDPLGVVPQRLTAIRNTHHRLAQFLAGGMDEVRAAVLCNYSTSRVSILKNDPAFKELLAYYANRVEEEFGDFVSAAAGLGLDALQELQERLSDKPETFTNQALLELVKTTADRSGNAPVTRNVNTNIHIDMGEKLRLARQRANNALIESRTGSGD